MCRLLEHDNFGSHVLFQCCDGHCPSCEQICGKQLGCRNHKCAAPCHLGNSCSEQSFFVTRIVSKSLLFCLGPCYPCVLTADLSCFCGATKVTVLCGKEKSTKPPRCRELCTIPTTCHHPRRQNHYCHFGDCPLCILPCLLPLPCGHSCMARCHTEPRRPARKPGQAPWIKLDSVEKVVLPCPPCLQPIQRYLIIY